MDAGEDGMCASNTGMAVKEVSPVSQLIAASPNCLANKKRKVVGLFQTNSPHKAAKEQLLKKKFQLMTLKKELNKRKETLSKYHQLESLTESNTISRLQGSVDKWPSACIELIHHYLDLCKTHSNGSQQVPQTTELLAYLRVDPHLLGYNPEDDCFEY